MRNDHVIPCVAILMAKDDEGPGLGSLGFGVLSQSPN